MHNGDHYRPLTQGPAHDGRMMGLERFSAGLEVRITRVQHRNFKQIQVGSKHCYYKLLC